MAERDLRNYVRGRVANYEAEQAAFTASNAVNSEAWDE